MATTLKIYNTLTNKKEEFKPIDPAHITMYVCGPTVYDYAHVGNARPVVVFDTLARLLRHDYGNLTYARNITDIDDKIIEASQKSGEDISVITEKFAAIYEEDMTALNAQMPDITPKATEYVEEMIALIADLIEKGNAYESEGHVLFQVSTMSDYGELSNRNVEDLLAGARVDVADYKREAPDFVLWKPSTPEQPGWDSPWGRGRPGWHTECSAMIEKNFGNTIDIHGGGQDLIFPHHENEIAQSKCSHGGAALANYWMHNGYLTVDSEKMSKSLGNFVTVHELLEDYGDVVGEAVRMSLLTAHYRQPVDFSHEGILQANKQLEKWYNLTLDVRATEPAEEILEALRNDLNTPKAIMELHQLAKNENRRGELLASAQLLGLLVVVRPEIESYDPSDPNLYSNEASESLRISLKLAMSENNKIARNNICNELLKRRTEIKSKAMSVDKKDPKRKEYYKEADIIREIFKENDLIIKDTPDGPILEKD